MKTVSLLLGLSLVANVVLAVGWLRLKPATIPVGLGSTEVAQATGADATKADAAARWAQIDAANIDELAARLPGMGFTPAEASAILSWKISQMFPPRRPRADVPYWKSQRVDFMDPKVQEETYARALAQQELYRKYLHRPELLEEDSDVFLSTRARYGPNLSAEKLRALSEIELDYQFLQMKQALDRARSGRNRAEGESERDAQVLLEKEKQADIARLLSPEELAEYELRSSDTANRLRYQLDAFQPTEAEYRAIFGIHKAFDEKLRDPNLPPAERTALMSQMKAQVAATLGEERAVDYVESQTAGDQTSRLVARLGLPARTNREIRTLRDDLTQRAAAVRDDPQISATERSTKLAGLAQEARTKLQAKLGTQGFQAYYDLKNEWIRALEPPSGTP